MTNLLKISLAILLFCGCHSLTKDPNLSSENACQTPVFAKKLVKTVSKSNHPWIPDSLVTSETNYYFDLLGRIDTFNNGATGTKIHYLSNGNVERVVIIDNIELGKIWNNFYTYNAQNQIIKIKTIYTFVNDLQEYTQNYLYDSGGYVLKSWQEGGTKKLYYVRDNCGNFLHKNDKDDDTGTVHSTYDCNFDGSFNPFYIMGLNKIYPDQYSINNCTYSLWTWDCAGDYYGGPFNMTYEYNAEGLPTKMTYEQGFTTYFYE
jgi:hypothetical protein